MRNNPLSLVDPTGTTTTGPCGGNLSTCWQNPAAYSQYINQQMYAGSNDLANGDDLFQIQQMTITPAAEVWVLDDNTTAEIIQISAPVFSFLSMVQTSERLPPLLPTWAIREQTQLLLPEKEVVS